MSVNNKEIKGEVKDLRLVSAKGFVGNWKCVEEIMPRHF